MFLKSLTIENVNGIIRKLAFHPGMNLVVDETPSTEAQITGNNVGKTTVLKLIDVCLGADPKRIYTDLENPKAEYGDVKKFLIDTKVIVTLALCESFQKASDRDLVIERNFLARKACIRRINGTACSESEFEKALTDHLFPGHYGNKPTFVQIISHNIRYKEPSVSNTLKTLNAFTRDEEYEALYLFLLGVDFDRGDEKQDLLAQLRAESAYKQRLESTATKAQYKISLDIVLDEIRGLEQRKGSFAKSSDLDGKITALGHAKYEKSFAGAELARLRLRHDLVSDAVRDVHARKSDIDVDELQTLYRDVSERLTVVTRTFSDLVSFHNSMVEEKARYIAKDLPRLQREIASQESKIAALTKLEQSYSEEIASSGALDDLEDVVNALNDRHRQRGEYEKVIEQISEAEAAISTVESRLGDIDKLLFSEDAESKIHQQVLKFNKNFSAISDELYGEKYALTFDRVKTKTGQQVYKFRCFNTNNFSSGKKQGEITCFDIAYTLFADDQKIPCYHFLLNDKKELMHDNQLARIGELVTRKSGQLQFVASILRDKLPPELDNDKLVVVKLSQDDKLFRIENDGRAPGAIVDGAV
ncbi:DUF2326 domain-containing protein [Dyella sp. Tek66A03]|uniref:DUF2326 domain-containing protein n=1 Tax=Dyella sp. Tek66A03 TaxID=3458298 RepID=UPI00403E3CE6